MASSSNTDDNSKIDELMKWATALRPDTLDLFSDFGGANVFIIDIDALILELFCDKHLLWQKGAQTLHAVYLVEQALHNFSVRGGLFEVVCFTESSNIIWKKFGPNRLFAREVILLHLRQGIKHPFKTFTTWWSQEFKDYLQAVQPSFVTVATGFETFAQKKNEFGKCAWHVVFVKFPVMVPPQLIIMYRFRRSNEDYDSTIHIDTSTVSALHQAERGTV